MNYEAQKGLLNNDYFNSNQKKEEDLTNNAIKICSGCRTKKTTVEMFRSTLYCPHYRCGECFKESIRSCTIAISDGKPISPLYLECADSKCQEKNSEARMVSLFRMMFR